MEFLRLKEGVGFLLDVEGISSFKQKAGFVQLGGEARAARYQILSSPLPPLPLPTPLPPRFKMVLLTPAWFSEGWQPRDGNWEKFFSGGAPRLGAAAIRRAQPIGGAFVDDRHRKSNFQKVMRRFVPAGSLYFFESEDTLAYKGKPFTETPPGEGDFGQIGFGSVVIAEWDYARRGG
jgi:CRISPR-associated protein Cmr3